MDKKIVKEIMPGELINDNDQAILLRILKAGDYRLQKIDESTGFWHTLKEWTADNDHPVD